MKFTLAPGWQQKFRLSESSRAFFTPLPLHLAGTLLLAALNVYLAIHMAFAYGIAHRNNQDAIAEQNSQMKATEIAARPLRGLDEKLALSENDQAMFYSSRLPVAYSTVVGELGDLAQKNNVRLTRVQYTQAPALGGAPDAALTQVTMDANLSGDYRPLMQFLNGLERSKSFFLVSGITLSGQQSGTVNLRMRLLTYLRAPRSGETADNSPLSGDTDAGKKGAAQ
jgi:hypothetical protein